MHLDLLELLNDDAVFRRTASGQRELTDPLSRLSRIEKRFLGAVTGHTPLRVLMDLGLDDPAVSEAIVELASRGLVAQMPSAGDFEFPAPGPAVDADQLRGPACRDPRE